MKIKALKPYGLRAFIVKYPENLILKNQSKLNFFNQIHTTNPKRKFAVFTKFETVFGKDVDQSLTVGECMHRGLKVIVGIFVAGE